MNHDWEDVARPPLKEKLGIPLSCHLDTTRGPINAETVRRWKCRRCGFDMETNVPPDEYKKAPPDCHLEVVRQVMES